MPKRKYSEQTINTARLTGRTLEAQQAFADRRKRKAERARIDAFTTPGYKKRPVTPLTPAQIRSQKAAALRERLTPPSRLDELSKVLGRKKK